MQKLPIIFQQKMADFFLCYAWKFKIVNFEQSCPGFITVTTKCTWLNTHLCLGVKSIYMYLVDGRHHQVRFRGLEEATVHTMLYTSRWVRLFVYGIHLGSFPFSYLYFRELEKKHTITRNVSIWHRGPRLAPWVSWHFDQSTDTSRITRLAEADLCNIKGNNTNPKILTLQNYPKSLSCDFTSFLKVFQLYQNDVWMIMKGCLQWNYVCCWEDFASSGNQTRSTRSVGQRLTHWATGALTIRTLKSTCYKNLNIAKLA